jgi:hypothetical protein
MASYAPASKLLDYFYCPSLWVAAPLAFLFGKSRCERALLWPSLSAGASLPEQATITALTAPRATFSEDPADVRNYNASPEEN